MFPNPSQQRFNCQNKLFVLRFTKLGYVPPGFYSTSILSENGTPVLVCEYGFLEKKKIFVDGALPRMQLAFPWLRFLPSKIRAAFLFFSSLFTIFIKILKEGNPRLIAAHGLSEQTIAFFLHKFLKIPYMVHVHEIITRNELSPFNKLLFYFEGQSLGCADFLIFPERERADIYIKRYGLRNPVYIVFNCPRLLPAQKSIDLRQKYGLPQQSILMNYIGGIGPTNALEIAIEALRDFPNIYFFIWGFGETAFKENLRKLSENHGVSHQILGLTELKEEKWPFLAGTDISYCLYKRVDLRTEHLATASNKLTESIAMGVPVIVNNGPDFAQIVVKNQIGIPVKEMTVEGVKEALRWFVEHPEQRRQMVLNEKELYRNQLHYEKQFFPLFSQYAHYFEILKTQEQFKRAG